MTLALTMRPQVVDEVEAALGVRPFQGIVTSMEASEVAFTLTLRGEVAAIWGARATYGCPPMGDGAMAWLLSSTVADKHKAAYMKATRAIVGALLETYPALFNYVDARYKAALRWAEWLGFSVGPPEPYGVAGLPFHPIIIRRSPCA